MLAIWEALLESSYYYFHTSCTAVSRRFVDTCLYWWTSFFVSGKVQRGTCRFRDSSAWAPRTETRRIHDLGRRRHESLVQSLRSRIAKFRWRSWTHQNRKQALFIPEPVRIYSYPFLLVACSSRVNARRITIILFFQYKLKEKCIKHNHDHKGGCVIYWGGGGGGGGLEQVFTP